MNRRGLEIRVGAVVVVGIALLAWGLMWFQDFRFGASGYEIFVRLSEVGGLVSGDRVNVNGVASGQVDAVELVDGQVMVKLGINEGVKIPADSKVVLKSVGIMGERFVAITTGTSPTMLANGGVIDGEFRAGVSELMSGMGLILEDVREVTTQLNQVLTSVNRDGRLDTSIDNLSAASGSVRELAVENAPKLDQAIADFAEVTSRMNALLNKHYASLDSTMEGFARMGRAAADLETVSADLKKITQQLQDGEGSLGQLIQSDETVNRLNATINNLDSLITDIKRRPGRYVKFELF